MLDASFREREREREWEKIDTVTFGIYENIFKWMYKELSYITKKNFEIMYVCVCERER